MAAEPEVRAERLRSEAEDRRDGPAVVVNVDDSSPAGLARTQFTRIMEALNAMSEDLNQKITELNAEVADVRATQELISAAVADLHTNLDAAQAANVALQGQIDVLVADAAVSASTIATLNEQATNAATAIGDATANLDSIDEALETVAGEN